MVLDISNAEKIFTETHIYSEIEGLEIDYINGRQFVKFSYDSGMFRRKYIAIDCNDIKKLEFKDTVTSHLKTVQDVMTAFRDGRLVGR